MWLRFTTIKNAAMVLSSNTTNPTPEYTEENKMEVGKCYDNIS